MRTGFFILCCLLQCTIAFAQSKDSIVLAPVTVYGYPDAKYLAGSAIHTVDSAAKAIDNSRHLGEVLALQIPAYFRNYGSGMLSGISLRGTSPQHTAVLWNGININSFSLGQADFSILPAAAFDEIKVHEGAGSARFGSGAFGGTVLLNSSSPTQNSIRVTQEVGSFGRYFTSLSGTSSVGRWSFQTRFYNLNSKNNFRILHTGGRQQHAGFRQSGILQDVIYRFSKTSSISLHYWYHDADRDIQPGIGQFNSTDNQQDRNHRLSIKYQHQSATYGVLSAYGGFVRDVLVFNGGGSSVARWIAGGRHEYVFGDNIHLQVGAEWNHIIGRIPDYNNGKAIEDRYDFTGSLQKNFGNRLSLAFNARQPVVSGFQAPFLPYVGGDYFLVQGNQHSLKLRGSVSKNYRIPTLNDRYWQNAGDKNLLPETTHAGEAGWVWNYRGFEISNTWFAQRVDQWIQWVPQENGVFRPRNVKQVLAEGIEMKITGVVKINEWSIRPMFTYQYTKSIIQQAPANESYTIGKQLIYTPLHTGSVYVQIIHKSWSGFINAQSSGQRFTNSSNSPDYALPAFAIFNAGAGRYLTLGKHRLDGLFSVRNILNTNYQLYADYAQPGRTYNLQINYQLTPNHESK